MQKCARYYVSLRLKSQLNMANNLYNYEWIQESRNKEL